MSDTINIIEKTVAGFVTEAEKLIKDGYVFFEEGLEYPTQGFLYEAVMKKGKAVPVEDNSPHVTIAFASFGDFAMTIQKYVANNYDVDLRDGYAPDLTHQFIATLHKRPEEIIPTSKFEDVEKQFVKPRAKPNKAKTGGDNDV